VGRLGSAHKEYHDDLPRGESTPTGGIGEWVKNRPWYGQTVFTFPVSQESLSKEQTQVTAGQDLSRDAAQDLLNCSEEKLCSDAADMMFEVKKIRSKDSPLAELACEEMCALCESRPSMVGCGCYSAAVGVCGACCLLRHTEQRYQVHETNEFCNTFERVAKLQEVLTVVGTVRKRIGFTRALRWNQRSSKTLELSGIIPVLYISNENDAN
jgi:hypothetical protein